VALVLKRILLVLGLWLLLSAATIRCSSGTFRDDDDNDRPGQNRAPVASNSFLQTSLNQAVSDRMQATDPDGDTLSFRVTAGPDRGSLTRLDDRGFFTYLPAEPGSDQFSFRANDGELDSNTAQVVIRVLLTAADTGGRTKPGGTTGLAGVFPDAARPDGLLVLWGGAAGSLDSVPAAGPVETRLAAVAAVAVDPWQAGRLVALRKDGRLLESRDAGISWAGRGRLARPAAGAELALAGTRVVIARPAPVCGAGAPAPAVHGALSAIEVCGHAPFVGADGDAYVLTGAPGAAELTALAPGVIPATGAPPANLREAESSGSAEARPVGRILGRAVIRAGSDLRRAGRLWVLDAGPNGYRLRVSDDAGLRWTAPDPLPAGRAVDALTDAAGRLWLAVAVGDRETLVYQLDGQAWTSTGGAAAAAGRLHRCGGGVCLLDPDGQRLWRLPAGG
jgi:hypothetical protein